MCTESCFGGNAPEPPNPLATAAAQTGTNVSTAIANAYLNSTNQITPTGSLTYTQGGTFPYTDPTTGQTFQIPRFTATQTLSPNQQALQDTKEQSQINLANLSADQSARMRAYLGGNFDPNALAPAAGDPNSLNVADPTSTFDSSSTNRERIEAGLMSRLQPQIDYDRAKLQQQLADQGIRYGSPAYDEAFRTFNDQVAAQRVAVLQQGAAEQQQAYTQAAGRATFANQSLAQQLAQRQNILAARNTARSQSLQEQYARRAQPIQEISALLSQGQVSLPSWVQTPTTQIPTTDIAGLINQNFNQQFQNYQTQQQAQNQLLGGILGAGSNIGAAFLRSDRRAKKDIHRIGTVFAAEPQPVEEPSRKKLPVYEYSYKDDPASMRHVGPMAQDVERIDSDAVGEDRHGIKYINVPRVMGSILRAT
jgi:hypothetical protein